jgi:hypothetical protein
MCEQKSRTDVQKLHALEPVMVQVYRLSMWVPVTEKERIEKARRIVCIRLIIFSCVWLVFSLFTSLFSSGAEILRGRPDLVPGDEFLPRFALRLGMGVVVLGLVWIIAGVTKYRVGSSDKTLICPKCGETCDTSPSAKCSCGGKFVPLNEVKWIEETDP